MTALLLRLQTWSHARETSQIEREQAGTITDLQDQIASLQEELESERTIGRVKQLQIDELTLVVARNFERVKREIKDLGGGNSAMKPGDAATIDT